MMPTKPQKNVRKGNLILIGFDDAKVVWVVILLRCIQWKIKY